MIRSASILFLVLAACGDSNGGQPEPKICSHNSGMGMIADHDVPCDPGGNAILFTASGEAFAKDGYGFPPASPDDVFLVDGWAITYTRIVTTFDHITLSRGPDKSPTDQSQCDDGKGGAILCGTGGSVVAQVDGPFAIDLQKGGPLADADGAELDSAPVAALLGLNKEGNAAFDAKVRYAFGFEIVKAAKGAHNVNLDAAGLTDYQEMVTKGYTTLLVGTATWKGNNNGSLTSSGCTATTVTPTYNFAVLPRTVNFRFGFIAPTVYRNAQNPANDPAEAFPSEEHQRGVQITANAATIAQLTFHIDHVLWESFVHDSPPHFDQFAAKYAGMATANATMEDFKGFGFKPFVDSQGHQVPFRSCVDAQTYAPPSDGAMAFDTLNIAVNPSGNPAQVIRDFYDYVTYNHSTFGHLNADGLSFVDRQYPSPP